MNRAATFTAAALAATAMTLPTTTAAHADTAIRCDTRRVTVQTGGEDYTLVGDLCQPAAGADRIQLLVHGATYNRHYWNPPVHTANLSYQRRAAELGFATFAYDRLGAGDSDTPSALFTMGRAADVLTQLARRFTRDFRHVTVVGHSLGSVITVQAAAQQPRNGPIDRLVVTGMLHGVPAPIGTGTLFAGLLGLRCPDGRCGYLTTLPGVRGHVFYSDTANPEVIAWDEHTKDVMAPGQLVTAVPEILPLLSAASGVTVPTMVVQGGADVVFCGLLEPCTAASVRAGESRFYRNVPELGVYVEPTAGHSLALHPTSRATTTAIARWITST